MRLQIDPLWWAFSKIYVYRDRLRRLRVDGRPKRTKRYAFTNVNVYALWTGSQFHNKEHTRQTNLRDDYFNEIVKDLFSDHDDCQLQQQLKQTASWVTLNENKNSEIKTNRWSGFQLSVESSSSLLWFYFTSNCDWPAKLAPLSQKKTKTNRALLAGIFPPLAPFTWHVSVFLLAYSAACVFCDWSE